MPVGHGQQLPMLNLAVTQNYRTYMNIHISSYYITQGLADDSVARPYKPFFAFDLMPFFVSAGR